MILFAFMSDVIHQSDFSPAPIEMHPELRHSWYFCFNVTGFLCRLI